MEQILYIVVAIVVLTIAYKILSGLVKFALIVALIAAAGYIYYTYFMHGALPA